jgi:sugar/nucleoside kinase (ribokinase family)
VSERVAAAWPPWAPVEPGRAVFVGITVLDLIQRVPRTPDWGRKSVSTSSEIAAGGPAANAAVTAAALLGSATLISAVGRGPAADLARADLAEHGVDLVDCAPAGWQLPAAACLVDEAGERSVISPGATGSPVELGSAGHAAVAGAAGLLVDGHHPRAGEAAVRRRPSGCVAVLDAGSAKPGVEAWLPRLDVVAGSADYAAGLGLDLAGALAHVLAAGAAAGVMTDGAAPLAWADRQTPRPRWLTPPQTAARDTVGAGDAFHGALLAAVICGLDLAEAVAAAAWVASTRVGRVGARSWLPDAQAGWQTRAWRP